MTSGVGVGLRAWEDLYGEWVREPGRGVGPVGWSTRPGRADGVPCWWSGVSRDGVHV